MTVTKNQLKAVDALTKHVTAIENLKPQLMEVLEPGRNHPLFSTVASETHNLAHIVACYTLYLK